MGPWIPIEREKLVEFCRRHRIRRDRVLAEGDRVFVLPAVETV